LKSSIQWTFEQSWVKSVQRHQKTQLINIIWYWYLYLSNTCVHNSLKFARTFIQKYSLETNNIFLTNNFSMIFYDHELSLDILGMPVDRQITRIRFLSTSCINFRCRNSILTSSGINFLCRTTFFAISGIKFFCRS
jgi:hypothetical protein